MNGWCGTILHIDLGTRQCRLEHPLLQTYRTWLGGRGLAGAYLETAGGRTIDDPALPLLFMTGPLVGTASPTSGRMCIMSRSPLTGTIGDCSVGGGLGTELKKAGLDGLVINGKSKTLCGIEIQDTEIRFHDAQSWTGAGTSILHANLQSKGSVACIGPAGEHGVLFANIIIDGHFAAGRNGLGTVMGGKNLKYLTVKGTGAIQIHDPQGLQQGARASPHRR